MESLHLELIPITLFRYFRINLLMPACIALLAFVAYSPSHAQEKFLVVEKMGSKKRQVYHVGDEITFRVSDEDFYQTSVITNLNISWFSSGNNVTPLDSISHIKLREKSEGLRIEKLQTPLIIAAVGYFGLDFINTRIVQNTKYSIEPEVYKPTIVLVTAALLLAPLKARKRKLSGNWRIRYVELY